MYVLENLKKTLGRVTGAGRPSVPSARRAVRRSKPQAMVFKDDGSVPNNARLPFLIYRGAVGPTGSANPAAVMEELFNANDWGDSWRNGIYEFVHYHSRTHEVLGIARGHGLAATTARSSHCEAGMSSSFRPEPAINAFPQANSFSSSGLIPLPAAMTNACPCPSTASAP